MVQDNLQKGTYLLVIRLSRTARVCFGAQGLRRLEAGYYAYAGRASRALSGRLRRYLGIAGGKCRENRVNTAEGRSFRLRWHVDYLLAHRYASIAGIRLADRNPDSECATARRAARLPGASTLPGRIGASDCKEGCPGHLFLLGREMPAEMDAMFPCRLLHSLGKL